MICGAVVQSQGGQEYLAMAGNLGSKMRLLELEVWSDREHADGGYADGDQLKGSDGGSSTVFRKRTSKKVSKPHRCDGDKENLDPSWPSHRLLAEVRTPCLHQRYPLQDITSLIHSLQGQLPTSTTGISRRPGVINKSMVCRSAGNFASKRANMKQLDILHLR
ncbi:hypothetical protein GOP47_0006044 [Adiantum capillus-veneris]|uniref:Uncharacterized protein n=1 Tax=Adiantum capillus-veneris TaxID=13818 RepID=A0A9D4V2B6_ADICA|nr:hypothetical protein GOP47_0006044 [Adiantum capillus-veneris]